MTEINLVEEISLVDFSDVPADKGIMSKVLNAVAAAGISVDMIGQTPPKSDRFSFGFSFAEEYVAKLLTVMRDITAKYGITPYVNSGNVKVVIKNPEMADCAGFAAKVFAVAEEISAPILLVTTGIDEISLLMPDGYSEELALRLKNTL